MEKEPIIIECDERLTDEHLKRLMEYWKPIADSSGRKVVILNKGMRVSQNAQLKRIEEKLDSILAWVQPTNQP